MRSTIVRLAQLVATVLVTWFIATRAGLSMAELEGVDFEQWQLRWAPLVASCFVLLGGFFSTGMLWGRIVVDLGGPVLPASESIRLFMVGNLGRYVPGKVWQIAGLAVLARERGIPAPTAAAAAILGQGTGLVAASIIGLGALWHWTVPVLVVIALAIGLAPPVFRGLVGLLFRLARAEPPGGLTSSAAALWLLVSVGSWVMYAGSFWLLVEGLGFDTSVFATAPAFAASYLIGYVVLFAPAGIGVREGALITLLTPALGVGSAGAVAAIARLWMTIIEVIPAAAFWTRRVAVVDGLPEPK